MSKGRREFDAARKLGGKKRRAFKRRLRERDGDNCYLCREPMQFDDPSRDDYATFEHVIPNLLDGEFTADNLRLSHYSCNQARGRMHERIYLNV